MIRDDNANEFLLITSKRESEHHVVVTLHLKVNEPDLTDYVLIRTKENGLEEYVHKDDFEFYKKIYDSGKQP